MLFLLLLQTKPVPVTNLRVVNPEATFLDMAWDDDIHSASRRMWLCENTAVLNETWFKWKGWIHKQLGTSAIHCQYCWYMNFWYLIRFEVFHCFLFVLSYDDRPVKLLILSTLAKIWTPFIFYLFLLLKIRNYLKNGLRIVTRHSFLVVLSCLKCLQGGFLINPDPAAARLVRSRIVNSVSWNCAFTAGYLVTWEPENAPGGSEFGEKTVQDTRTRITGLQPSTPYAVTVQAIQEGQYSWPTRAIGVTEDGKQTLSGSSCSATTCVFHFPFSEFFCQANVPLPIVQCLSGII